MRTKNKQPSDWREALRLQALELQKKGWKQSKIAEALGVSAGAVCQWFKKVKEQGTEALRQTRPESPTGGGAFGGGGSLRLYRTTVDQQASSLANPIQVRRKVSPRSRLAPAARRTKLECAETSGSSQPAR